MKRIFNLVLWAALGANVTAASTRSVDAVYVARISDISEGTGDLRVWIPLPASDAHQTVSDLRIDSPYDWTIATEPTFGNRYAFATVRNPAASLEIAVHFRVARRTPAREDAGGGREEGLRRALAADRLVTISPRIRRIAAEVTRGESTPLGQARAIFEYVLKSMKYDKTLPGWGRGDTERACEVGAGNCTDFHSLFISLARAKGIPARFIIGFPMPDRRGGEISGYHCWAEFYVEGRGWIPVDASEAWKSVDSAKRNFFFGNLDVDRVAFTTGRDVTLNPQTSEPLNYFIYPHAERAGKPVGAATIALRYQTIDASAADAAQSAKPPAAR